MEDEEFKLQIPAQPEAEEVDTTLLDLEGVFL